MKYVIQIDMDNDIFMNEDGNPCLDSARHEMARILSELAIGIKQDGIQRETKIYSHDGNGVGTAKVIDGNTTEHQPMSLVSLKCRTKPGTKLTRTYTMHGGHKSKHLVIVGQDNDYMIWSTADEPKVKYHHSWPLPGEIQDIGDGFNILDERGEIAATYKWGHI